jgi:hypothetical protein
MMEPSGGNLRLDGVGSTLMHDYIRRVKYLLFYSYGVDVQVRYHVRTLDVTTEV